MRGRPVTFYVPEKRADGLNYDISKVQPAPSKKLKLDWVSESARTLRQFNSKVKSLVEQTSLPLKAVQLINLLFLLGVRIPRQRLPLESLSTAHRRDRVLCCRNRCALQHRRAVPATLFGPHRRHQEFDDSSQQVADRDWTMCWSRSTNRCASHSRLEFGLAGDNGDHWR